MMLPVAIALFAMAMLLAAYRLVIGPEQADRILALDALYLFALGTVLLYGLWIADAVFVEASLLIGLFGFVGTVVVSKFLLKGDIAT
jgi:multicomponent K+:H+ antiporter subunit F